MDKNNLDLFKQALSEGLSDKFDSIAGEYTEEIVCSEKHEIAMRAIVYGKAGEKRALASKMKRMIAIFVAIALLLTSCGIIFRNEIREIFAGVFVKLTYETKDTSEDMITEIYTLEHVPEGYVLKTEAISKMYVLYEFINESGDILCFEQRAMVGSGFVVDSENGYSRIVEIDEYEVYYRFIGENHLYIWNNEKYSINIKSSTQLSNEEIVLMLDGITTK